jgi:hypothetical protein
MYETEFRIRHTRFSSKEMYRDKVGDPTVRQAVVIATVAFNMFFNDVKALVKAGVEADIARGREEDGEVGEVAANIATKRRLQKMKVWMSRGTGMLDYAEDNFATLLRVIVTDPEAIVRGLPGTDVNEISTTRFATDLYNMVSRPTTNPIGAPIKPNGAFHPALHVAVRHITKMAPVNPPQFVVQVLRLATELLRIRFIPWKKASEGVGRPSRIPVWDCWATLGARDVTKDVNSLTLRPEEALQKAAMDAQNAAMGRDHNVSWMTGGIKLREVGECLERAGLPTDWATPSKASGYVLETYEYVRDIYDNKNAVHRLAMLVGVVLGRCLPNVHAPVNSGEKLREATNRATTRKIARSLPWVAKNKTRGSKEGHIHVCMFATFIIVLYDENSPLRRYMASHDDSLGDLWSDKHRKCWCV